MRFHTILSEYDIDEDYKKFLKTVPRDTLDLMGVTHLDPFSFSKSYMENHVADVSVSPNANVGRRSPNNYYMESCKSQEALLCFEDLLKTARGLFSDFSLDNFFNGGLYFHDKTKYKMPYCIGVTTTNLLMQGKPFGNLHSKPPKRLHSFIGQVAEFIMIHSQQNAGAVAPTDLPATMAWYLKNETDDQIENYYQSLVHIVNNEFRVGGDSPFTNVMISSFGPYEQMFKDFRFPDGRDIHDLRDNIERVNGIIMDFVMKGDPLRNGAPYRFPIHTLQVTKEDVDTDEFQRFAAKNRLGHFNVNQTEQFSMCCRFMPNPEDEILKTGYFGGGGGMQLGSHRIVTLNLPWIAYEHRKTGRDVYEIIDVLLKDAIKALVAHKVLLKKYIDAHMLLFFDIGWMHLDQLYSTIGFHGFPEFLQILGMDYRTKDGIQFGKRILVDIRMKLKECSRRMSEVAGMTIKFNMEEIPAEGATGTMAKMNNARFGSKDVFYSNQFVPLYDDIPLHERLSIESELNSILTGGSMVTVNLLDVMDEENSLTLHRKIVGETDVSQFSLNYGWSICDCGEASVGVVETCKCGGTPRFYTRVVGYFAPVENWCGVRKDELRTRKWYTV